MSPPTARTDKKPALKNGLSVTASKLLLLAQERERATWRMSLSVGLRAAYRSEVARLEELAAAGLSGSGHEVAVQKNVDDLVEAMTILGFRVP